MIVTQTTKLRDLFRVVSVKSGFRFFQPKIEFELSGQDYIIRTASTLDELERILNLRNRVFFNEWRGENAPGNLDLDQFDLNSDHLMVIEKATGLVVGTYRIRTTEFNSKFYAETEFNLRDFLATPGSKMELGRACTHPLHRNGAVIQALWRGIAEYMRLSGSEQLFGCSSISGLAKTHFQSLQGELFKKGAFDPSLSVTPLPEMSISRNLHHFMRDPELGEQPIAFPLLDLYLKAGAKISPLPAVDVAFDCVDYFTLLDRSCMSPLFRRRYGL